jgi:monothiol glutaredoxin
MFRRGALTSVRKEHAMSDTETSNAITRIKQEVGANDVVLFMKGTPNFPQCGFSGQVAKILAFLDVPYKGVNVLEDAEIREGVKQYANWPTIPQLYVKGEFVGGCDIIREMFQSGELLDHLKAAGVPVKDPQQA